MPVTLRYVRPHEFDHYWPQVERALNWKVARFDRVKLYLLKAAVQVGVQDLWIAPLVGFPLRLSSVIVTTIVAIPREPKTLRVELLAGRHIGTWIDSTACTLGQHAQAHGCIRFAITGRLGWRHYHDRFPLPVIWTCDRESNRADHANQPDHNL